MKLLKQYYKIVKQIYDYFDCPEKLPIDDFTEFYYKVIKNKIYYSSDFSNQPNEFNDTFVKSYDGDDYVMFHVKDTSDDGSLCIFDKTKLIDNLDEYSE